MQTTLKRPGMGEARSSLITRTNTYEHVYPSQFWVLFLVAQPELFQIWQAVSLKHIQDQRSLTGNNRYYCNMSIIIVFVEITTVYTRKWADAFHTR
jgi:hypothetical protein